MVEGVFMMCCAAEETTGPGILIVEDSGPLRRALREWLETAFPGAAVADAGSGEEAIELAERDSPDLILMDIGLPGMDGVEATRAIMRRRPDIRVVVLSIHEDQEYRSRAEAAGAIAFVPKRTMRSTLLSVLRPLLGGVGSGLSSGSPHP